MFGVGGPQRRHGLAPRAVAGVEGAAHRDAADQDRKAGRASVGDPRSRPIGGERVALSAGRDERGHGPTMTGPGVWVLSTHCSTSRTPRMLLATQQAMAA